ncbi:MAG TPA: ornithine cyclodeaminase family protein [Candidatus Galloscillospira excrementipullorum]|nr:ornithine cyclodeaminase family protein [Candidatus Galloscillospira excrementipullorum]
MLYLTKEDMCKVFSMRDAFEALHDAFTLYSSGKSTVPLRSMIDVPHHRGQAIFMPALAGDALGIKIVSTYPDNPVRGKPVTPACMLVMDASTGEACCLMDGTYLTQLRTAAGAGLATEVLAAPGARVGALIGLGGQAPCQFDAMLEAAPTLREVRVFDIDENLRAAFAAQRDGAGGVRVVAAQSADEAVRGANIVTTVTTSRKPVFSADSIQKGCHVNAIGSYTPEMQELPPELVAGCDLLVLDTADGVLHESGDILKPLEAGLLEGKKIDTEMGHILLGGHGRLKDDDVTLYKSTGSGVMDVVTAAAIFRRAQQMGVGKHL